MRGWIVVVHVMAAMWAGCSIKNRTFDPGEDASTPPPAKDSGTSNGIPDAGPKRWDAGLDCTDCGDPRDAGVDAGPKVWDAGPTCPDCGRAVQVAVADGHACAIVEPGDVWCWGSNRHGKLCPASGVVMGDGPVRTRFSDVVEVTTGREHTCARHRDGSVSCCGSDRLGELGDGPGDSTGTLTTPIASGARDIGGKRRKTCAVLDSGVTCWGEYDSSRRLLQSPTPVPGSSGATMVDSNGYHSCALFAGQPKCWGQNIPVAAGREYLDADAPTEVASVNDATMITTGANFTCAMRTGGSAYCWGNGRFGQLGSDSGSAAIDFSVVELTAGRIHACARVGSAAGGLRCSAGATTTTTSLASAVRTTAGTAEGRRWRYSTENRSTAVTTRAAAS